MERLIYIRIFRHKYLDFLFFIGLILLFIGIGMGIANDKLFSFQTAFLLAILVSLGFLVNPEKWFWLIPVAILLPLHLGDVAGIPRFSVKEIAIPLFFMALLAREVVKRDFLKILSIRHNPLNLPIFFFFAVVFLNYFRRPLMPANLLGLSSEMGGLRTYYKFFLGISAYTMALYICSYSHEEFKKTLKLMLYFSIFLCLLGISMYIFNFSLPGIEIFRWLVHPLSYGAVRIGFIGGFGQLGLLLLLANPIRFRWRFLKYILGFLFTLSLFLSGGRAVVVATSVAILVWLFMKKRHLLFTSTLIALIAIYLSLPVIYSFAPSPQLRRLADIRSMQESSVGRYYIYKYGMSEFLKHPLFGTGLGKTYNVSKNLPVPSDFLEGQLRMGGHATYVALLKNFGLVGFLPFIGILVVAFVNCFKMGRTRTFNRKWHLELAQIPEIATFLGLYIVAYAVGCVAGGDGTSIFSYFVLGMIAALISLRNNTTGEQQ